MNSASNFSFCCPLLCMCTLCRTGIRSMRDWMASKRNPDFVLIRGNTVAQVQNPIESAARRSGDFHSNEFDFIWTYYLRTVQCLWQITNSTQFLNFNSKAWSKLFRNGSQKKFCWWFFLLVRRSRNRETLFGTWVEFFSLVFSLFAIGKKPEMVLQRCCVHCAHCLHEADSSRVFAVTAITLNVKCLYRATILPLFRLRWFSVLMRRRLHRTRIHCEWRRKKVLFYHRVWNWIQNAVWKLIHFSHHQSDYRKCSTFYCRISECVANRRECVVWNGRRFAANAGCPFVAAGWCCGSIAVTILSVVCSPMPFQRLPWFMWRISWTSAPPDFR